MSNRVMADSCRSAVSCTEPLSKLEDVGAYARGACISSQIGVAGDWRAVRLAIIVAVYAAGLTLDSSTSSCSPFAMFPTSSSNRLFHASYCASSGSFPSLSRAIRPRPTLAVGRAEGLKVSYFRRPGGPLILDRCGSQCRCWREVQGVDEKVTSGWMPKDASNELPLSYR